MPRTADEIIGKFALMPRIKEVSTVTAPYKRRCKLCDFDQRLCQKAGNDRAEIGKFLDHVRTGVWADGQCI